MKKGTVISWGKKENIYGYIFFAFSLFGILGYLLINIKYGSSIMEWMIQENDLGIRLCDYFSHIYFSAAPKELYTRMVDECGCFPPLTYVMYYSFFRMTRAGDYMPDAVHDVEKMGGFYLVFTYFIIVTVILFLGGILLSSKGQNYVKSILLFVCLVFSASFMGSGFFVGNSAMLVLALLTLALALKDNSSLICRELALILIAVCAGLKIYPAVFGLLYLKEKRWKEAIRLIIYGIIFFFTPFLYFGGFQGMLLWLGHIKGTMGLLEYGRVEYIKGLVYFIAIQFGVVDSAGLNRLCSIIPTVFLVIMVVLAAISKNKYRTYLFLVSLMIFYPTNSFRYTLCYLSVPLIFWLQNDGDSEITTVENIFYAILYGLLFSIPIVWGIITHFKNTYGPYNLTYVEVRLYFVAYILLLYTIFLEGKTLLLRRKKQR